MPDLLGGGVHEHVAVLGRPAAVPPLEEVGHHDADLAPLASEELLHLPGEDGVWVVGLGVVLELLGVEEHLCSFPSDQPRGWGALLASTITSTVVPPTVPPKRGRCWTGTRQLTPSGPFRPAIQRSAKKACFRNSLPSLRTRSTGKKFDVRVSFRVRAMRRGGKIT